MPLVIAAAALLSPVWTQLFNGKDLSGWTKRGGNATYSVKDGVIVGRTSPGPNTFLCTEKVYADFELELDVWVDSRVNSGIQFRSNSVGGYQNGVVHGYQAEVDPTNRAWSGGIYDESRRGWLDDLKDNPKGQKAFKVAKWNHYRIVARGDHLQTWVNKVATADLHDSLSYKGFIALQVHGHETPGIEVRFKNVRIKDLGDPRANPPKGGKWLLKAQSDLANWTPERNFGQACPWQWVDGAMQVMPGTGDLNTREKFTDCQLHMEFMVDENGKGGQENGNSGVYLMQSYELQILNSAPRGPADNECGGVYTIKAPDYAMAYPAGAWQTYDIWFTAPKWEGGKKVSNARMRAIHNGTVIHQDLEIPRNTGAGQSEAPQARPIRLQDHGHPIRFRNVWVAPLPKS